MNTDGISFGKYNERMYTKLSSANPIDFCRYQVNNCFLATPNYSIAALLLPVKRIKRKSYALPY